MSSEKKESANQSQQPSQIENSSAPDRLQASELDLGLSAASQFSLDDKFSASWGRISLEDEAGRRQDQDLGADAFVPSGQDEGSNSWPQADQGAENSDFGPESDSDAVSDLATAHSLGTEASKQLVADLGSSDDLAGDEDRGGQLDPAVKTGQEAGISSAEKIEAVGADIAVEMPFISGLGQEGAPVPESEDEQRVWGNQYLPSASGRASSSKTAAFDPSSISVKKNEPAGKKKSWKGRVIAALCVLILIGILVAAGILSGFFTTLLEREGASTPEAAVSGYYQALLEGDRDQLCLLLSPQARAETVSGLGGQVSNTDLEDGLKLSQCKEQISEETMQQIAEGYTSGPKLEDLTYEVVEQTETQATVKVSDSTDESLSANTVVELRSNRWFISGSDQQTAANQ